MSPDAILAWFKILIFLLGVWIVYATSLSAVRTFVLPRSAPDPLSALVFIGLRRLFNLRLRPSQPYHQRDALMAFYAPMALLTLLPVWLILVALGFTLMYWATGIDSWIEAFTISGSSLLTLGFARGPDFIHTLLAFAEATLGLMLIALLIAYLPTMYSAYSRRELQVTLLEVRAGSPPSALDLLLRAYRLERIPELHDLWGSWETWFAEIEESHSSLAALVFFRSSQPRHSWVTASGAILDSAAYVASTLDEPRDVQAELCIRAGYLALRHIADFFSLTYKHDPHYPDDPISVQRSEYDALCDQLSAAGVRLKADRDQAWLDFAGWRVNYDTVLLALASLTMAPDAPWSSDRAPIFKLPSFWNRSQRAPLNANRNSKEEEAS